MAYFFQRISLSLFFSSGKIGYWSFYKKGHMKKVEMSVLDQLVCLTKINPALANLYYESVKTNTPFPFALKSIKKKNKTCFEKNIKPKGQLGKMVGVEIECWLPTKNFTVSGGEFDICDYDYCESLAKLFDALSLKGDSVTEDGSLEYGPKGHFGAEIQVMFPISNPAPLKRVIEVLTFLKATVNKNCGLHVHVDLRNLSSKSDRKKVFEQVEYSLPILGALIEPYRCDSEYSSIYQTDVSDSHNKESALVLHWLKTLEFRLHQGSVNYDEILAWVKVCYAVTHSKELKKTLPPRSLQELAYFTNLDDQVMKILNKKYSQSRSDSISKEMDANWRDLINDEY